MQVPQGITLLTRRSLQAHRLAALALLALALSGCVGDETRAMTATCERFVANGDASGSDALLRDAEAKLASLDKPSNAVTRYIRNLQDPDALAHRAALRECVWRLRSLRG